MLRVAVRRMASRAGIANDDLARKAMLEPTTAAHVGALFRWIDEAVALVARV